MVGRVEQSETRLKDLKEQWTSLRTGATAGLSNSAFREDTAGGVGSGTHQGEISLMVHPRTRIDGWKIGPMRLAADGLLRADSLDNKS